MPVCKAEVTSRYHDIRWRESSTEENDGQGKIWITWQDCKVVVCSWEGATTCRAHRLVVAFLVSATTTNAWIRVESKRGDCLDANSIGVRGVCDVVLFVIRERTNRRLLQDDAVGSRHILRRRPAEIGVYDSQYDDHSNRFAANFPPFLKW